MPKTLTEILGKVDLDVISKLKGGWEGWLQVELAMAMMRTGFDASREAYPYSDKSLRADLQLVRPSVDVIVEMKCQSVGQKGFEKMVLADVVKLKTLESQRIGVMVAVVDATTVLALKKVGFNVAPKGLDESGTWYLYVYTGVA